MNLFISGGLLIIIPIVLRLLTPKHDNEITPMPSTMRPWRLSISRARRLPPTDRASPIVVWALALMLVYAFVPLLDEGRLHVARPQRSEHRHAGSGSSCTARSVPTKPPKMARGCAGIILQFPLYAGIMGMLASSGLINDFSRFMASIANETTALKSSHSPSAAIVTVFVPSGGGQWGIQGPPAGSRLSAESWRCACQDDHGRGVWRSADQHAPALLKALPLLAITKVKVCEIVGYTAVVMIVAALWMVAAGVLVPLRPSTSAQGD
ncbi:MAG: TIGR00366 family protein [Phycisphaerales bacterium]